MKAIVRVLKIDGSLVEVVRLSTGEVEVYECPNIMEHLIALNLKGDPTGLVFTWDSIPNKPIKYIGCVRTGDILLDVHQPEAWMKPLGVTERVPLDSGDVAFNTVHGFTVGIESKLGGDLYASLFSTTEAASRLSTQIPKLVSTYDIPILLMDFSGITSTFDGFVYLPSMGKYKGHMRRPWSAISNTLLGYQLVWPKLALWIARKTFRMPYDILKIREYLNKMEHLSQVETPTVLLKFYKQSMPEDMAWLAALVGPETARKAMEVYPTLWQLMNAPEKDLLKVPQWGPKTVSKLLKTLRRE